MLKKLRNYLGRIIRDIGRRSRATAGSRGVCKLLSLARRVREQQQRQRGPKVYSLHAPKSNASQGQSPSPFTSSRVKVSVATPLRHCKGGQFRQPM